MGTPDFAVPTLGEIVGAAIVLAPGVSMTEDDLRAALDGHIARFKIPERLWFLDDSLPRNANGKFVKRQLRESLIGA